MIDSSSSTWCDARTSWSRISAPASSTGSVCFEALDPLNPGSDTTVRRGGSGYDQIAQGEAGLMSLTGSGPDDPEKVRTPIADLLAGMDGAYPFQSTRWTIAGEVGRAQGNHHASIAPYGPFHWADGSV
jgi:crotonobetainyl-CoA:carnitine CoA-transferase CaiB-like acyl-CoA transferase